MAIFHSQPWLLLLASLFFLPAFRANDVSVKFEYCNKSGYDLANVSRVVVSPNSWRPEDPRLRITVYGYTKERFYEGIIEVYARSKRRLDILKRFDLCMLGSCAIEVGKNFMLPLKEVPKYIEGDLKYLVALFDGDAGGGEFRPRMCVEFALPTLTPTLVYT